MPGDETYLSEVAAHYHARQDLEGSILAALAAAGKDPEQLQAEDLIGIDEFHVRGRSATRGLARDLSPSAAMAVLDLGCGLGGAARHLAREFGCRVTGLDLNPEYCRAAASLTRRLGLDNLVSFCQGNALDLPFPDRSFDVVWTQHAAMNIADKERLYREASRVLKPGGRIALYDVMAGSGGEPHFPVPWAREPRTSFLISQEKLAETLSLAGFEILAWRDVTEAGREWFRKQQEKTGAGDAPPLGLQLLLGSEFRAMARNQFLNLDQGRIALVEAVGRRPRC